MNKVSINGLEVFPFTSEEELLDYISQTNGILVAINSEKIKGANDDTRSIANSNIGYVDGVGALLVLRRKGIKNAIKIPGCELWLKIIQRFGGTKSFYLIGGKQEVITDVVGKLKHEYPNINIVGYRNGYIKTSEEREKLIEDVAIKKPDVVFVAMGSPLQEYLMRDLYKVHPAIYQGLGGSFDVYTGRVRRAPKWFSDHYLEGVYRMFWEPKKRIKGVLSDVWFFIAVKLGKY